MNQNSLTPESTPADNANKHDAEGRLTPQPAGGDIAPGSKDEKDEAAAKLDERIELALSAASDKKALDLLVLDLRAIASFTDYFLIAGGTNVRQVQAIADEVVERLKKQGVKPARVEGYKAAEWVLVDYGDFIVHVFETKARRFYDLERLWRGAARIALPAELIGGGSSSSSSGETAAATTAAANNGAVEGREGDGGGDDDSGLRRQK